MSFSAGIERLNLVILNGELELAGRELNQLQPDTAVEHRIARHFAGILAFHRGQFAEAKAIMEHAITHYGENVNLLRDLAVAQYHLQDMQGFRFSLARLERALSETEGVLTPRSQLECELVVGKFLEEEAKLCRAFNFYKRALSRAESPSHRLRTLIQVARWLTLYEPAEPLADYYRELISVALEGLTKDLRVELEHSLVLIELRLIGADHAWQRVARLESEVAGIDQRLIFFDFLEGALAQDLELDAIVLEKMNSFTDLDPFESFLARLVNGSISGVGMIHELTLLAPKISWSSYLRLLCLAANMESNSSVRLELNRKIQLIVSALDGKDQALWNQRLKQALQTPEIRLDYSARNRSVAVQGRSVDLSKKKMGIQLLEGLAQRTELSVDEAIALLWQASFSPEHYHRLRMGIHRLNTLINKVTGLGKIIEVDSQTVKLRPEVKICRSDEAVL